LKPFAESCLRRRVQCQLRSICLCLEDHSVCFVCTPAVAVTGLL
jgi:hypothetical protein